MFSGSSGIIGNTSPADGVAPNDVIANVVMRREREREREDADDGFETE
jgi:hypothetical protein